MRTNRQIPINRCPHCRLTVQRGIIQWSCDSWHPEFLAALEQIERENEEDEDTPQDQPPRTIQQKK